MNPIAIRLLSQQLICPQFDTPQKVVSHFGAMQAQDYRMVRWAVMMRTRKPSSIAFKKAFDEGEIVRLHLLRGTWQLVSNEDYLWMLDLISPKATSVVKGWMKSNKISIDDSELNLIHEIFVQKNDEMQSVTSKDLNEALLERASSWTNIAYPTTFALTNWTVLSAAAIFFLQRRHTVSQKRRFQEQPGWNVMKC